MVLEPKVAWVTALGCEAHPIREALGLEAVKTDGPFPLYRSACARHWLVRSGMGRTNAAAATMYLHQHLDGPGHIAWLNVGVAGHGDLPLGTPRRVYQIHEAATDRVFYPTQVFESSLEGAVLTTVDQPKKEMADQSLYDMEGSAFFEIASRVSSQELVALVKCVSDHGSDGTAWPKKEVVSQWIADQMAHIRAMADGLMTLSESEGRRLAAPNGYECLDQIHFTVTQAHQIRRLLRRWQTLRPAVSIQTVIESCQTARQVIALLRRELDRETIDWSGP